MPIVGLTDQLAALPIIGELRKGEKKVSDKRPGIDLTYFRMTSTYGDVVTDFYSHYDEKPRIINAYLPHEKAEQNFDAWMEEWVAGGLVHRCDGQTCVLWRTPKGDYSTEPKPCPGNCKQVGRLSVIVPELGRYATVTVLTTSIHDIKNIARQLRMYESMSGDLRGVPVVVRRAPHQISTPGPDGKRVRREKWLLSIETKPEWTKAKMLEVANQAMPQLPEPESIRQIEAEYEIIEALPDDSPFDEVDEDTGEVLEPQAEPQPPRNGNVTRRHPPRPWEAEYLRDYISKKVAEQGNTATASQAQLTYANLAVKSLLTGDNKDNDRRSIIKYLFGVDSSKELTVAQASKLIEWTGSTEDNQHQPEETSVREAQKILTRFKVEAGQTSFIE